MRNLFATINCVISQKEQKQRFCLPFKWQRSTVTVHVWVLSAVVTVFWCMSSACRIHLHANFLHFLARQTFTMIHILPSAPQTRWDWLSGWIYLFLLRLFVHGRVSDGLASERRNRGSGEGDDICLCLRAHLSPLTLSCPILCLLL